jgi:hypothetical protein
MAINSVLLPEICSDILGLETLFQERLWIFGYFVFWLDIGESPESPGYFDCTTSGAFWRENREEGLFQFGFG